MGQRPSDSAYLQTITESYLESTIQRIQLILNNAEHDEDATGGYNMMEEALIGIQHELQRRKFDACMQELLATVPLVDKKKEISITSCLADLNARFDTAISYDLVTTAAEDILQLILDQHDDIAESINVNFCERRQFYIATSNFIVSRELHQRKFRMCLDDMLMLMQFRRSNKPTYIQRWIESTSDADSDD